MSIPSRPAGSIVALHGLIAGDDILEHPGQYMMQARIPVSSGRAFVQGKPLAPLSLSNAPLKDIVLLPKVQYLLLKFWKISLALYCLEHMLSNPHKLHFSRAQLGVSSPVNILSHSRYKNSSLIPVSIIDQGNTSSFSLSRRA